MAQAAADGGATGSGWRPQKFEDLLQSLRDGLQKNAVGREESLLRARLQEYSTQYSLLRKAWRKVREEDREVPELDKIVSAPPAMLHEPEDSLRTWRLALLEGILDLDANLPPQPLRAEHMRCELSEAFTSVCGTESLPAFMKSCMLRRMDSLHVQRASVAARLRGRFTSQVEATAFGCDSPHGTLVRSSVLRAAVDVSLKLIDKELEATEARLSQKTGGSNEDAAAQVRVTSHLVLLRRRAVEEVATSLLRKFLTRLQFLGFEHGRALWRRALELRLAMDMPRQDSQLPPAPRACMPVDIGSRRQVERLLLDLGKQFGCNATLHSDKGKTFAHHATLAFPQVFSRLQRRWEFRMHPIGEYLQSQRNSALAQSPDALPDMNAAGDLTTDADIWYMRSSGWERNVPWSPKVDPVILEQTALLRASFAAARAPSRMHHKDGSYARQLLEGALAKAEMPPAGVPHDETGIWEPDVDSVLHAEMEFLAVGDIKVVSRRLGEAAEGRVSRDRHEEASHSSATGFTSSVSGTIAPRKETEGGEERQPVPPAYLRAFYLLRHLRCRAQRWELLGILNFYRFVQRRLVSALPKPSVVDSPVDGGRESPTSERVGRRKQWDAPSQSLARQGRQFLPPTTGMTTNLDRESLVRLDEDYVAVVDEDGRRVMHALALEDLAALERDMLSIGSYYIHKLEDVGGAAPEQTAADRVGVLADLYAAELRFNTEKRNLLEAYLEIHEHTTDLVERADLAQRIIDVIASRPQLDMASTYFVDSYAASIALYGQRDSLLRRLVGHQVSTECAVVEMFRKKLPVVSRPCSGSSPRSSRMPNTLRDRGSPDTSSPLKRQTFVGIPGENGSRVATPHSIADKEAELVTLSFAHPGEGYGCSAPPAVGAASHKPQVTLGPCSGQVGVADFFGSAAMAWKAELILEEVQSDLVARFKPNSSDLVTLIGRACYSFAADMWRVLQEEDARKTLPLSPHEDPELTFQVVCECAKRLTRPLHSTEQREEADRASTPGAIGEIGGLDLNGYMLQSLGELRRRFGKRKASLVSAMMDKLVEFSFLRLLLGDTAREVALLERILKLQAPFFSAQAAAVRPDTLLPAEDGEKEKSNDWIDPAGPALAASVLTREFGHVELGTARSIALQCSPIWNFEIRSLYQHELGYRNLALCCVQHNALLLDSQARQSELDDTRLHGVPHDILANDAGLATMWKLRETSELSGQQKLGRLTAPEPGPLGDKESYTDMSRHKNLFQTPAARLSQALLIVRDAFQECTGSDLEDSREQPHLQDESRMRAFWFQLLACFTAFALREACDLSVRLQAVHTARSLRCLVSLLPKAMSPFECAHPGQQVNHQMPFVERGGLVGNVFSVPSDLEILQMRGAHRHDMLDEFLAALRSFAPEAFTLTPAGQEAERMNRARAGPTSPKHRQSVSSRVSARASTPERGGADSPSGSTSPVWARATTTEKAPVSGRHDEPQPSLDVTLESPALTALNLLSELIRLVSLRYTFVAVHGAPVTLIRAQHGARFRLPGTALPHDDLGRTEHTAEAFDELGLELGRVGLRLSALGENAREAQQVFCVLKSEVRAAHAQLACLLRSGERKFLSDGCAGEHALEIRRKGICALERLAAWASGRVGAPAGTGLPLASLPGSRCPTSALETDPVTASARVGDSVLAGWANHAGAAEQSEPELLTLCQDSTRYMHEHHPKAVSTHPLLDRFTYSLFGNAASLVPRLAKNQSAPFSARLLWRYPSAPTPPIILAILSLPRWCRHQLDGAASALAEKRNAFHQLANAAENTVAITDADSEFFGALLLAETLKEMLPSVQPQVAPAPVSLIPCWLQEPEDTLVEPHFSVQQEALMHMVASEVMHARRQIADLLPAIDKLLVSFASQRVALELAGVAEVRHRLCSVALARRLGAAGRAETKKNCGRSPDLHAKKVGSILAALNRLRSASSYAQMEPQGGGERVHVVREDDLDTCILELMTSLVTFGDDIVRGRAKVGNELLGFLSFRSKTAVSSLARCAAPVEDRGPLIGTGTFTSSGGLSTGLLRLQLVEDADVREEVAERGCQLVFEVDRLHRSLKELRSVSQELEQRLKGQIWENVRDSISSITQSLGVTTGVFKETHGQTACDLAARMRQIREHVAGELAELAARCHSVQTAAELPRQLESWSEADEERGEDPLTSLRTPPPGPAHPQGQLPGQALVVSDGMHEKISEVASRDNVHVLQLKIEDLSNMLLVARIFHVFKCQAMRQKFDQQMRALWMTLTSNVQLSEQFARESKHAQTVVQDFGKASQHRAVQELRIEERRTRLEADEEQRHRLLGWKQSKFKQVSYLEREVRGHERTCTLDVEALAQDVEEKRERVHKLQRAREEGARAEVRSAKESSAKTAKVRAELRHQQDRKLSTHEELRYLRAEVDAGSLTNEERLTLWQGRTEVALQRLAELREENRRLRQTTRQADVAQ